MLACVLSLPLSCVFLVFFLLCLYIRPWNDCSSSALWGTLQFNSGNYVFVRIYVEIRPSYVMGGAEWCVTGAGAVFLCDLAAVLVCRCRVCVHRRGAGPLPGGALFPLRWCVLRVLECVLLLLPLLLYSTTTADDCLTSPGCSLSFFIVLKIRSTILGVESWNGSLGGLGVAL